MNYAEYHFKQIYNLTDQVYQEIYTFCQMVNQAYQLKAPNFISNTYHFDKKIPSAILAYSGEILAAVALFYAESQQNIEVTIKVHPDYRHQGIFLALKEQTEKIQAEFQVEEILWVTENIFSKTYPAFFAHYDLVETELYLLYKGKSQIDIQAQYTLLELGQEDLEDIVDVCAYAFGNSYETTTRFAQERLDDPDSKQYGLYLEDTLVATTAVNLKDGLFYIFGTVVKESIRGRGIGQQLIAQIIRHLQETPTPIAISVSKSNLPAFHIYQKNGFEAETEIEYYKEK